jgi:hypothetical protein
MVAHTNTAMSNVEFGILDEREDGSGGITITGVSSPGNFAAGTGDSNLVGNAAGGIVSGLIADPLPRRHFGHHFSHPVRH